MKVYSILLFLVFLNLVMGFTFAMINVEDPDTHESYFLPQAAGVLKNPSSENFTERLTELKDNINVFINNPNPVTFLDGCLSFLTTAGQFFMTIISTPAELISKIIPVPDILVNIITMGMTIITCFTLVQLLTGRWFSFVE